MLYQRSTPLSKAGPKLSKIAAEMSVMKKKEKMGDIETFTRSVKAHPGMH